MITKAVITSVESFVQQDSGIYEMTVHALVAVGNASVDVTAVASSATFDKLVPPPWRTLIRDAVIVEVSKRFGLTLDGVVFPDAGVSVI